MTIHKHFHSLLLPLLLCGFLAARMAGAVPLAGFPESIDEFQITPFLTHSTDYSEAVSLLENDEYEKVVALGKQYVGSNPRDAKAHLILVLGWIGLGDEPAIERHLSELNRKLPQVANAIEYNMAKFYASRDNYEKALSYLPEMPADKGKLDVMHLRASIYTHQGKNDKAIASYQEILTQTPTDEPALLKLATLYLTERDYKKSTSHAQRLVALTPESIVALTVLGTNQLLLNQPSKAAGTFEKVTLLDPKSAIGLLNLATAYHSLRQFDDAHNTYEKLARTYPETREGHTGLALVYLAQGKPEKAKQAAEQAIAVSPQYPVAHLAFAAIAVAENDFLAANLAFKNSGNLYIDFQRPDFDTAAYFRHEPTASAMSLATSVFFAQQGYSALALNAMSGTSTDHKQAPFLAITRARMTWKLGQPKKAQTILQNVSRDFPLLVTPIIESADISYFSNEPAIALRGYQSAVHKAPELTTLYINLGNIYNALGEPEKAVEEYQKYLAKDPRSAYVLNQVAATLTEKQNMPERALSFALDAQKIDPDSVKIKDTLGEIYFRLGRFEESLKQYEGIASVSPTIDPHTYYRIGLNHIGLEDKEKAVIFIERALNTGKDFRLRSEAVKKLNQLKNI